MEHYNDLISSHVLDNYDKMIEKLPQPTMFGGKRARKYVLPASTEYDYPATLAVGSLDGKSPDMLGGSFWDDFGKGLQTVSNTLAPFAPALMAMGRDGGAMMPRVGADGHGIYRPAVMPRVGGRAKDPVRDWVSAIGSVVNPALLVGLGKGKKGRKPTPEEMMMMHQQMMGGKSAWDVFGKLNPLLLGYDLGHDVIAPALMGKGGKRGAKKGGFGFKDIGKAFKSVGHALAPVGHALTPVAQAVATDVAKDALKGLLAPSPAGAGRRRGRPRKMAIPDGMEGGFGLKDIGDAFKSVGHALAPVAKTALDIAPLAMMAMGRDAGSRNSGFVKKHMYKPEFDLSKIHDPSENLKAISPAWKKKKGGRPKGSKNKPKAPKAPVELEEVEEEMEGSGYGGVLIPDRPHQFHSSVYPPALASYHAVAKKGAGRKPSARGAIVKKVMHEMGMSLPQASKYVKEHGLY